MKAFQRLALVATVLIPILSLRAAPESAAPGPLHNTFTRLTSGLPVKIVVIGNSVTAGGAADTDENPSFYAALRKWFVRTFPQARVDVVPRIIYAIGPEVQFFYQDTRLLPEEPDLVLAEFGAANGAWGRTGIAVTGPATEGYVRRLRVLRPQTDVILMMGIFKTMLDDYQSGTTPPSAQFLHRVAAHYNCLAADAGAEVARRVIAGEPWETFMKDFIHPSPGGYVLYSDTLVASLEREWQRFQSMGVVSKPGDHALPAKTLHPSPWTAPRLVPAATAKTEGFEPRTHGPVTYLESVRPDATGRYTAPSGRQVVGVFMREGKPTGNLDIRTPGGDWTTLTQKKTPHFTVKEDRPNKLFRNFFVTDGISGTVTEFEFRVSPEPEVTGATTVQIVGFFEIAAP